MDLSVIPSSSLTDHHAADAVWFYRGRASAIPPELEGIVVTADLQGLVPHPLTQEPELMGLAVVDQLVDLYLDGQIPSPVRMAAALAGDFFAFADTRGGFGHSSKPGRINWIGSRLWQKPDRTFSSCTKVHPVGLGNRGSR